MNDERARASEIGVSTTEHQELAQVHDEIVSGELTKGHDRRVHNRYIPRFKEAMIELEPASGPPVRSHAMLCDIGHETIGLVTRAYIHLHTPCKLELQTLDREKIQLTGHVFRCDYYASRVHRVAVRFEGPIEPRDFVSSQEWARSTLRAEGEDWVRPRSALLIEPDERIAESMTSMLERSSFDCVRVKQLQEVPVALDTARFDLLVFSGSYAQSAIESQLSRISDRSTLGRVAILGEPRQDAITPSGRIEAVFQSPAEFISVLDVLRSLFGSHTDPAGDDQKPIHTVLRPSECTKAELDRFLMSTQQRAESIESLAQGRKIEPLLRICASIHASSPGFGYPLLTRQASEVIEALNTFHTLENKVVSSAIEGLLDVIARLRGHKNKA